MSRRWDWAPPTAPARPWTGVIGVVFGLMLLFVRPWLGAAVLATGAAVIGAWVAWPAATDRFFTAVSHGIGWVIGRVALTMVFVLVIIPLRLVRRSDTLSLRFPGTEASYWRARLPRDPDSRRRWS